MQESSDLRQRRPGAGTADDSASRCTDDEEKKNAGGGRFGLLGMIFVFLFVLPPVALVVIDYTMESPIEPVSFNLPEPPEYVGPMAPNELLKSAEHLYEGKLRGPESLIVRHGHIYTGTADGKILHIEKDQIEVVATLGKPPCGSFEDEPTCGRPLGMRFDKDGYLIVADAYLGLFKVNVATGEVHQLFSSEEPIEGKKAQFMNDMDIGSDGMIYISDSSTKWDRRHNRMAVMEAASDGRLLRYDPATQKMTVLARDLHFANGVQLSRQEDFLLVSETTRCRILRYHLKGEKAGKMDVFSDNLPGLPDNVRLSGGGGYWVGMAVKRQRETFSGFDYTADKPWIRRIMTKIFSQETILRLISKPYGLLVELDKNGKIVRSLHDPSGTVVPAASEVDDQAGVLYVGSYFSPFIIKYDTSKHH